MKALILLAFISPALLAQCTEANQSGSNCSIALAASGSIVGASPAITAIYNWQYSTAVDAAAEMADIYYPTAYGTSGTSNCIDIAPHEGGGTAGDKSTFVLVGPRDFVVMIENDGCTMISPNYTLNTGTAPAMSPTQQIELSCLLHQVVHNAGTVFPGNIHNIRFIGFSWGRYLAHITNLALDHWTPNCEVNDAVPPIQGDFGIAEVWEFANEYGQGYAQFDTAVNAMFGCNSALTCAANGWIAGAPAAYVSAGKARVYTLEGADDSITPPSYQGAPMATAYADTSPPTTVGYSTMAAPPGCGGGGGHGCDWSCGTPNYRLSLCYNQIVNVLVNHGSIGGAGMGGTGIGQ